MYTFLFTAAAEGKGKSGEDFFQKVSCCLFLPFWSVQRKCPCFCNYTENPWKLPCLWRGGDFDKRAGDAQGKERMGCLLDLTILRRFLLGKSDAIFTGGKEAARAISQTAPMTFYCYLYFFLPQTPTWLGGGEESSQLSSFPVSMTMSGIIWLKCTFNSACSQLVTMLPICPLLSLKVPSLSEVSLASHI